MYQSKFSDPLTVLFVAVATWCGYAAYPLVIVYIYKVAFTFVGVGSFVFIGVVTSYPASGYRVQTSGAFNATGTNGYNWSCAVTGANAYYLNFNNTNVNPTNNNNRALGFPVRCVQHLYVFKSDPSY